MHVKVFRQSLDPVLFTIQDLQDLGLSMDPAFHFLPGHHVLANDIPLIRIQNHSHADKDLGKPAGAFLADGEVHDAEILRQEFDFGKADVRHPLALAVVSCLVDPDLLGQVDELGQRVADEPHFRRPDARSRGAVLEWQWCGCTVVAEANVHLRTSVTM